MSESEHKHLYSKPGEQADRLAEKMRDAEAFISSLESALHSQREALAKVGGSGDISEDERAMMIEGIAKNIREILARIDGTKLLRHEQSALLFRPLKYL